MSFLFLCLWDVCLNVFVGLCVRVIGIDVLLRMCTYISMCLFVCALYVLGCVSLSVLTFVSLYVCASVYYQLCVLMLVCVLDQVSYYVDVLRY